ncbi:MAG TPA: hypothetical protein DDW16_01620 [Clostridiales bacterium]|nr:hypothetical protein [Clostridiales bacterium]
MKKRISSIFLTLILVFTLIGTSVFTSCKDKEGGEKQEVALSEAVETDHADELADILLTLAENKDSEKKDFSVSTEENDDGTKNLLVKYKGITFISSLLDKKEITDKIILLLDNPILNAFGLFEKDYKTSLDLIGQKVLYPAGITNAKISEILVEFNKLLKSYYGFDKSVKNLENNYGKLDVYKDENGGKEDNKENSPEPTDSVNSSLKKGGFLSDLKSYIFGIYNKVDKKKVNDYVKKIKQEDKTEFLNKYDAFNVSKLKFINTLNFNVTGAILNFAYNYDNLGLNLSAETIAKLETLKSSLTALNIDSDEKKNAYAVLVGFAFEETKKTIALEKCINASDLIDLINSISKFQDATTASEKATILTEIGNSLSNVMATEGDVVIAMGNDTLSSSDKIKNACNVLDKNGLGYFVNRFLPLYANGQVFAGTLLKNFSKSDLLALLNCRSNGLISDEFVKSEDPDYFSTGDEGLYRVAEIVCHNLQTALNNLKDKKAFINAIDLAMGDGGTFSKYFLGLVEKMDGYYASDYSKNLSFDKLAKADQDAIKQTYSDIIVAVSGIQVAMDGMTEAINSVKNYVQPILNFIKSI